MAKRFLVVILLIGMVACLPCVRIGYGAELKDPDIFYQEAESISIDPNESSTFDISYCILDVNNAYDYGDRFWPILFQLTLVNKTEHALNDLVINAHFNEAMQIVLVNSTWYNEPHTVAAYGSKNSPYGVEYSWQALVDLLALGVYGNITTESFYSMNIEITWSDGYEVVKFSRDSIVHWDKTYPDSIRMLDDDTITKMNEEGIKRRIEWFGE